MVLRFPPCPSADYYEIGSLLSSCSACLLALSVDYYGIGSMWSPLSSLLICWLLWNWFYVISLSSNSSLWLLWNWFYVSPFPPCSCLFPTPPRYEIEKWILIVSFALSLFTLSLFFPFVPFFSLCKPLFNRLDMYLSLLRHVIGHINSYSMICLFLYRLQTIST